MGQKRDSCLVNGREAIRLSVYENAVLTKVADDGDGDGVPKNNTKKSEGH